MIFNQASPTIIQMSLTNGELDTTDAENDSFFGPQFHRVFNNNRPIDWTVLDKIKQLDVMEELDHLISWDKIKNPPHS